MNLALTSGRCGLRRGQGRRALSWLLLLSLPWSVFVASAAADGGTLLGNASRGLRSFAVFVAPTPVRVGPADISVLVQSAAHSEKDPPAGAPLEIAAWPVDHAEMVIHTPATPAGATNKLLPSARLEFNEAGTWQIEVRLDGLPLEPRLTYAIEVLPPLPEAVVFAPWIGWPFLAIGLVVLHRRRRQSLAARRRVAGVNSSIQAAN
ncbi:MAG TPA: hypothetical protein VFE24_08770 [Pirellulales bacterium]|jgi:hypothetical protein|nr:hypothetical protein [Pirellulales bacterium]